MSAIFISHLKSEDTVLKPPEPISEPPKDIVAKRLISGPISEPPIVSKPIASPHKPPFSEPPKDIVLTISESQESPIVPKPPISEESPIVSKPPISEPPMPSDFVSKLLASIRSSLSFMTAISHLKPVSILLASIRSSLSFMTAISHLKPEDREPEDRENITFVFLGGSRPVRYEDFSSELFGLDAQCVAAIDSFNRKHNTKYEFLKIKSANRQHCGCGNTFYNTFQARQNDTTQDFETLVYKNFVTGDITLNFCRLKREMPSLELL
ncbi:hypothetical protein COLO4_19472 [Corchorus olitorius]|uniref:Uncharacterized protein n=1 Tax=Corchorus olitorius TaxID=93759 RepID=A0A1R3J592_9ROSI|nr:hypothetical protein COLO4_19472 [Corchorus olitorius]